MEGTHNKSGSMSCEMFVRGFSKATLSLSFFFSGTSQEEALRPDGSTATIAVVVVGGERQLPEEKTDPGVEQSQGNGKEMGSES